jgi:hypothetical protein
MSHVCKHCGANTPPDVARRDVCGRCAAGQVCEGCGGPAASGHRYCESCAVLLAGMDDTPKPVRDGAWLLWAAQVRGVIPWFVAFGRDRGYPRSMVEWSPGMVAVAVQAKIDGWHPMPTTQVYRQDDPLPIRRKGAIK